MVFTRRALSTLIWILIASLLLLHLFPGFISSNSPPQSAIPATPAPLLKRLNSLLRHTELQTIEEIPVFPAVTSGRRPKKKRNLDDPLSDLPPDQRQFFFPDPNVFAVNHPNQSDDERYYFFPGREWRDSEGSPIQAHGAGFLYEKENSTFFWYGENKLGPTYKLHRKSSARVDFSGISCYSSQDLWEWKNEGVVLRPELSNTSSDLHTSKVVERPKVIYNHLTRRYVMWIHVDNGNYSKASVGVATSIRPQGPFTYLGSMKPHGFDSRDLTIFKDDDESSSAFLVYSSNSNLELHVTQLTEDYVGLKNKVSRVLVNDHREAPAVFKHQGLYYMITSGCTGWSPNPALLHAAESMMGPWQTLGDPCVGASEEFRKTTFYSQVSYVLPLPGLVDMFVFVADRWNPGNLGDSRYVWLPLTVDGPLDEPLSDGAFEFPIWSRISVRWHMKWKLPITWNYTNSNIYI